jgi:TonB family protein
VARVRSYRRSFLIEALAISLGVQGVAVAGYEILRPEPPPVLVVTVLGLGSGSVNVFEDGKAEPVLRCDGSEPCRLVSRRGAALHMVAIPGDQSTFAGWSQLPMRTPEKLRKVAGDPLAGCIDFDLTDVTSIGNVMECRAALRGDLEVGVEFGIQPEQLDVAFDPVRDIEDVILPPSRKPVAPIDAEQLEEDAIDVALAPVEPEKIKQLELPEPEPQPQPPEAPKPLVQPPPNMTMVEVPDQNEADKAPDDATHLSDKNRDVAEETRATETNLDRESEGEQVASIEHDDTTSPEIGGPEDQIRQLEETEPTTDERIEESDHSGAAEVAKGAIVGEEGDEGEAGAGVLGMRGIRGRGSILDQGGDGKKRGDKGLPGLNTPLAFQDYERLMGKDKVEEERQIAARKMSAKQGRWEKKLAAIKSSLENFTPDVRPGNQTALKTRAHPFAVYMARMHRRIHELWGFGFLDSLDDKPADFALNDFELFTVIEISLNTDGTVHKTTVVKTSGKGEFDVAALDTVHTAGPYEAPPEAIRSVDGRVYMRWGFYRNWRQCGTFNAEPYILTEVPTDTGDAGESMDTTLARNRPRIGNPVTPAPKPSATDKIGATASVTDSKATYAANLWVSGFATAQIDKMLRFSATPFRAGADVAAESSKDLKQLYTGLVVESGKLKDWKLVSTDEYAKKFGTPINLGDDGAILVVTAEKGMFAIILQKMRSGDYRATHIIR